LQGGGERRCARSLAMALPTGSLPDGEPLGPAGSACPAGSAGSVAAVATAEPRRPKRERESEQETARSRAVLPRPSARLGVTPKLMPRQPPANTFAETRSVPAPKPRPPRARLSAKTQRGVPAQLCFAKLGIRHVEYLPEQLEWILPFLSAWPKTAPQAVLLLIYRNGAATPAECVCVRWRAAARRALPPSAPIPDVGPDGRRCFSAPPGCSCGWYWLKAIVLVQHLDELAALDWDSLTLAVERNELIRYDGGWRAERPQRAWNALMAAIDDLEHLELVEEQYWWGLAVGTAREVLWGLPSGTATCQVALFLDGVHWATNPSGGMVQLQLDMSRYHWIMLPAMDEDPVGAAYVDDWHLECYGNGAAMPPGAPRALASRPCRALA
jgi:hypothetical protein